MVRENCQRVYNHQITNKQSTDCLKNGLYENLIHKQLSIISFLACARTYAILERIFDDQFVSVGVVKLSIIGEKVMIIIFVTIRVTARVFLPWGADFLFMFEYVTSVSLIQ